MPTTTPTDPHITASLPVLILPGSPLADKNIKPATRNITMANPTNNGQIKPNILTTTSQRLVVVFGNAGGPAKVTMGRDNKTADENKITNFLFTLHPNELIILK